MSTVQKCLLVALVGANVQVVNYFCADYSTGWHGTTSAINSLGSGLFTGVALGNAFTAWLDSRFPRETNG